ILLHPPSGMLSYSINKVSLCIGDVSASPAVCTRTIVNGRCGPEVGRIVRACMDGQRSGSERYGSYETFNFVHD
ncbi:hypothetical protein P0D88_49485, partial [Paraburkholderia sp. RL18-103-BIB-C]|uniref:hypothetical protein n=1 Tax=Paraburkholderia sp. RL18-103-BIB-C TaxID=3031637 RepID=UPI0038BD7EE8